MDDISSTDLIAILYVICLTAGLLFYVYHKIFLEKMDENRSEITLKNYYPETWLDEKYNLYRSSLINHNNQQIEKTKTIKNTSLGMISFIGLVLPISSGLILKDGDFEQPLLVVLLFLSIVVSLLAIYAFIDSLNFWKVPEVAFNLRDEPTKQNGEACYIKNTENIADYDNKQFQAILLHYEVHETIARFEYNKQIGKSLYLGEHLIIIAICCLMTQMFIGISILGSLIIFTAMSAVIVIGVQITKKRMEKISSSIEKGISMNSSILFYEEKSTDST